MDNRIHQWNLKRRAVCLCFLFLFYLNSSSAFAQRVTIPVQTAGNSLVLQTDEFKNLSIIYYGEKLSDANEYSMIPQVYNQTSDYSGMLNSAYTSSGSRNLVEPAITVTHADGNNSLDLQYVSHDVKKIDDNVSQYAITLKDSVYDFSVILYYKAYYQQDLIEQWSVIKHKEKGNVILHKYASANLYLKAGSFWLNQYHGDWAREMQPQEAEQV
ncbi:MAG: alpha-galactosidase, partial [Chitinophagaceae bacterium]